MKLTFDVPEPPPLSVLVDDGELLVVVDEVVVVVDMVAGDQTVDRPTLKARAPNKTRTDHVSRRPRTGTESELRYRFQQNIRSMYFVLHPMRFALVQVERIRGLLVNALHGMDPVSGSWFLY